MDMQNRPFDGSSYLLRHRFSTTVRTGGFDTWVMMGQYIDFQGGRNGRHRHSFYEVCLVLDGQGIFYHGGTSLQVRVGDLFVADPGVVHEIVSDADCPLVIHFLSFSFRRLSDGAAVCRSSGQASPQDLMHAAIDAFLSRHELLRHGCERLAEDFRRIAALDASGASGAEMVVRSGYAVLALASSMVMELLEHSVDCPVSDSDQRLDAALHVLRDNVSRRLSVQEVALQAGTSERNLRRLFRKHCNCTVVGKANELRMQEAARMVATMPFIKIEAVALACGFDAVSDFSRAFKRFHGVSPGSYRNSGGTVRVPVGR